MLIRESGNPGIMCARVVSLGESFKVKFSIPLEHEYWTFATFTVIIGTSLLKLSTVALGITKVLTVPGLAISDSYFVVETQHKSFVCVSRMLEFKFGFTLMNLTVLRSILCCSTYHRFSTGTQNHVPRSKSKTTSYCEMIHFLHLVG